MTATLTNIHQAPSLAEIDFELDQFNDRLFDHGYNATVGMSAWGERVITVDLPTGATTEFYNDLDGFTAYSHATQDLVGVLEAVLA